MLNDQIKELDQLKDKLRTQTDLFMSSLASGNYFSRHQVEKILEITQNEIAKLESSTEDYVRPNDQKK